MHEADTCGDGCCANARHVPVVPRELYAAAAPPAVIEHEPEAVGHKRRRDLTADQQLEILGFRRSHTATPTLAKYPEVSLATLKRMRQRESATPDFVARGTGDSKRPSELNSTRN